MAKARRYKQGQRWQLKNPVVGFESSLVIARVEEAHPEWGQPETEYVLYIRYDPKAGVWTPPELDGVTYSCNAAILTRNVTRFLKSNVKLPWWWVYGRKYAKRSDAPGGTSRVLVQEDIDRLLRMDLEGRQQQANSRRQRAESYKKHRETFKKGMQLPPAPVSVAESWQRISAWFAKHAPGYGFSLSKGASEKTIATFEKTIGSKLPEDFRESVKLHNGGNCSIPPNRGDFLSLAQILEQWKMYRDWQKAGEYAVPGPDWKAKSLKGQIKPVFWNTKRIYITDNSGDHLTLDLDPPTPERYGQIIDHSHETGPERVLAPSWAAYLQKLVADLESGKYVYFEHECSVELRSEAKRDDAED